MSDGFLYFGVGLISVGLVLFWFKNIRYVHRLDLFSAGCLVFWFADWSRIFGLEAPILFAYPVFFISVSVAITHFVINQRARLDYDQIRLMRLVDNWKMGNLSILSGFTLISLFFPSHYLIYPIAMTLLFIRYALKVSLNGLK